MFSLKNRYSEVLVLQQNFRPPKLGAKVAIQNKGQAVGISETDCGAHASCDNRNHVNPSYKRTKTSPLAISPQLFHPKLKTLLFNKSYPYSSSSPYLPPVSTPNTIHHSRLTVCLPL